MYVVDKQIVKQNIESVRNAFADNGIDLLLTYSCKTNSMPEVLDIVRDNGVLYEIVSEHEFNLVRSRSNEKCICNGVAMNNQEAASHIKRGDLLNFNDMTQARNVKELLTDDVSYDIGLRVNFGNSRFGVPSDNLSKCIKELSDMNFNVISLHCHISGTRGLKKYRKKVRNMIDAILFAGISPKYIDFGGNMYGEMSTELSNCFDDVCGFNEYAHVISQEISRLDYKPVIILELGTALIANAVSVIAHVIRVDEFNRVVVDIDKFTLGGIVNKKIMYDFIGEDNEIVTKETFKVYGCTCMEDDLLIDDLRRHVNVGDVIEFKNCGAYSYCFEPEFIIPRQKVAVK